ncbi:MAG TPA: DUF4350 domain-containing protein [Steroidobacteraceae bacterium]|nr:DUF4350 domain-containing protein [Steroidobacteraceae bacterium]
MNDRVFTLLCAIGAFALFYGFFIGDFSGDDEKSAVSRPLSTEARPNGYLALRDWLAAEKIPSESLRHRYGWLANGKAGLKRTGNVLIVTLPGLRPQRSHEASDLVDWVRRGNTLVAVAGLFDTPEWGATPGGVMSELKDMTLLEFKVYRPDKKNDQPAGDDGETAGDEEEGDTYDAPFDRPRGFTVDRLTEPKAERMRPRGAHALTRGIESISAVSEFWSYKFTTASPEQGAVLEVLDDVDTGIPALWAGPLGAGTVVVSGYGSIFTNKMLGHADNARLFANLIAWRLGAGGVVVFDDMHQGASSFYDPDAFFKDPRLHATFWWIMALWLAWAVFATRLRATQPLLAAPRESGFIRSVGQFFARAVPRVAVGERLCEHLFNDIRRSLAWPQNGEPVWQWLRSLAVVPAAEVVELERLHGELAAGRKVDLTKLQNLILSIRKQVL